MRLLQVKIALCFLCLSFSAFTQIPENAYIKYVSYNPFTDEYSVAWYPSASTLVDKLELKYITSTAPLYTAKPIVNFPGNTAGELTFKVSDYPNVVSYFKEPMKISVGAIYNNKEPNSLSLYHQVVTITSEVQSCPNQISFHWTPYFGYNTTIQKQTIYKIDGTQAISVAVLSATDTAYTIALTTETGNNCYFLETEFLDLKGNIQTSRSYKTCQTVDIPKSPDYITPYYVENVNNTYNILKFNIDPTSEIKTFALARAKTPDQNYETIKTVQLTDSTIEIADTPQNNANQQYSYKLYAINNCGDKIDSSESISTTVLTASANLNYEAELLWLDQNNDADSYYLISRILNNNKEIIDSITYSMFYKESLVELASQTGNFCYTIIHKKHSNPVYTKISNSSCIQFQSRVFIPNAINPWSKNEGNHIFKPVASFIEQENYLFQVYSRWGELMFETTDMQAFWDGTFKNADCIQGTYTYYLRYTDSYGKKQEKRGLVHLFFNNGD